MFMPRAVSKAIDQIARKAVGKDWDVYAALLDHWAEIVGTEYAQVTTPVKINFPHQPNEPRRCNGTLIVRLPRGLAMEFSFKAEQMKQRVNRYFGYDAIGKIVLDPGYETASAPTTKSLPDPKALASIQETAAVLEDGDLRGALESFGAAVVKSSMK